MTVDLNVSVFNFENGGLRPDGSYDFSGLRVAFLDDPAPDLLLLNEAKFWRARGRTPFLRAVNDLAALHRRPYCGELFGGELGTAVLYDPTILMLDATEEPHFEDKRNLARFALRADPLVKLFVFVEHWSYHSAEERFARARLLSRYGTGPTPVLLGGDLNTTASGPHLPGIDWNRAPVATRDYKARQCPDGTWVADTQALDRLVGAWDPTVGGRVDGAGFHLAAELDPQAPTPLPPTVNGARGLHIDYLLLNDALATAGGVVPGTYQVHIPPGTDPAAWPSDHRRVSCTLRLRTSETVSALDTRP